MEEPERLAALRPRASGLDRDWLAGRRWFGARTRQLEAVELADAARLGGDRWLLVLVARFAAGGPERYLVPAVGGADGRLREPEDGEGVWRALVERALGGEDLPSAAGRFTFHARPLLAELLSATDADAPAEQRFAGEQSNTSVRLGDRVVMKLYRRVVAGVNPEIELNEFLSEVAFAHAPAYAGCIEYVPGAGGASAAALLQELVPARGDGWAWGLSALSRPPDGPQEALAAASLIGGITAQLHEALASRPDHPDFPSRPASAEERRAWQLAAERELEAAVAALPGEGPAAGQRARLEAIAPALRERLGAIGSAGDAWLSRIHGDYHLGQLLRTEDGFVVIDFEGEPARPLADRRAPTSPLRDVAGMLRSFDYLARSAARGMAADGDGRLEADAWLADARAAFLTAYAGEAVDRGLLAALEIEKACYEVRYEANHRPDWTWLPVDALERIASDGALA